MSDRHPNAEDPMEEAIDEFLTPPEARGLTKLIGYFAYCDKCGDRFLWPSGRKPKASAMPRYECKRCRIPMRVVSASEYIAEELSVGERDEAV